LRDSKFPVINLNIKLKTTMIAIILFSLILLVFFLISAAIIYHLVRYSPEKDKTFLSIGVYVTVSVILLIFSVANFSAIDWKDFFQF